MSDSRGMSFATMRETDNTRTVGKSNDKKQVNVYLDVSTIEEISEIQAGLGVLRGSRPSKSAVTSEALRRMAREIRERLRADSATAGLTLIELMSALAIAGLITAGAVFAFNTAAERAEGNAVLQGLQPFMVDMNNYLNVNHIEPDINEGAVAGDVSFTGKPFGPSPASNAMPSKTCTGATIVFFGTTTYTWSPSADTYVCTSALGLPGAANVGRAETISNPNMSRLTSIASLRHFDGVDEDGLAEWSIVLGESNQLDVAFKLIPQAGAPLAAGDSITAATANRAMGCPAVDGPGTDTAANFLIAIEDIDVCQHVANSLVGYEIVHNAQCFSGDTAIEWTTPGDHVDGDSALGICFATMK